jgi:hypothetical protein
LFGSCYYAGENPILVIDLDAYQAFLDGDKGFISQYGKIDRITAAAETVDVYIRKFTPRKFEVPVERIGLNPMVSGINNS